VSLVHIIKIGQEKKLHFYVLILKII